MSLFVACKKPNQKEPPKVAPESLQPTSPIAKQNGKTTGDDFEDLVKIIARTSISGSGARLVLGDQDSAIQEALKNGGKFVLVHPEVIGKLQQAGLDPYIVHITALINQMEARIAQIEFVNAGVEGLVQEWSNKPKDQVPFHVRQMVWLKANAEKFGYQQDGNRWKLKR